MPKFRMTSLIAGLVAVLVLIPVIALAVLSWMSSPAPTLGLPNGQLTECGKSPNCVSSQASQSSQRVDPIRFEGDPVLARQQLQQVLQNRPRTRIVKAENDYLRAVATSRLFRFQDDLEFLIDAQAREIHVRSASRAGHSDLGVNRRRVEEIRATFETLQGPAAAAAARDRSHPPEEVSTFSIVAWDPAERAWGIAVASRFLAVGSVVPWAQAEAGAIATQSFANTSYGPKGLTRLANGESAADVLNALTAEDPNAAGRQVGIVDAQGRAATYTGSGCRPWAGGRTGPGYACQGNLLTGPEVVDAMAGSFESAHGPLAWRLMQCLEAGDAEGGDRRGRQSAAILVVQNGRGYGGFNDRLIDFRVDDHPQPIEELARILALRLPRPLPEKVPMEPQP